MPSKADVPPRKQRGKRRRCSWCRVQRPGRLPCWSWREAVPVGGSRCADTHRHPGRPPAQPGGRPTGTEQGQPGEIGRLRQPCAEQPLWARGGGRGAGMAGQPQWTGGASGPREQGLGTEAPNRSRGEVCPHREMHVGNWRRQPLARPALGTELMRHAVYDLPKGRTRISRGTCQARRLRTRRGRL